MSTTRAPIFGGVPSPREAVVHLSNVQQASVCTAVLVERRVVLTAKHCVFGEAGLSAAGDLRVREGTGPGAWVAEHRVKSVHVLPGPYDAIGQDGNDLALLVLGTDALAPSPLPLSFDDPSTLEGTRITAVGFGRAEGGTGGTLREATVPVIAVLDAAEKTNVLVGVDPSLCPGDSGGPLLGPDGRVWGAASFISNPGSSTPPTCGSGIGFYNALIGEEAFVDAVLDEAGVCVPEPERCNGIDDNCDDVVDEGCVAFGEPCSHDEECIERCEDTGSGKVCTAACASFGNDADCPPGFSCVASRDCQGRCVARLSTALLPEGALCTSAASCQSGFCDEVESGQGVCRVPCFRGGALCLADEACAHTDGACGGCRAASTVDELRAAGEPCMQDADCEAGHCQNDFGVTYCADSCSNDESCGPGFYCRVNVCVPGARGRLGSRCRADADCEFGFRCTTDAIPVCAIPCAGNTCPSGFLCGADALCRSEAALDGQACNSAQDCLSRRCEVVSGRSVCTRACGSGVHCEVGVQCLRPVPDGDALCLTPGAPAASGCAAASLPRRAAVASPVRAVLSDLVLIFLVVVVTLGFRRRRHGAKHDRLGE